MISRDPRALAAVFIGGAAGTLARALLAQGWPAVHGQWPWATFTANVAGVAVLAAVLLTVHERLPYRRLLLGTGLCGGLTTFSTVQVELVVMLRDREFALVATYLTASLAAGLLAAHVVTRVVNIVREERE
ncbi:MAG: hypothetical protein BGO26_10370 [Actinobacteria bacterium 69-20]|nr:fluoride efflux transporter CrcB [Actinomycetota bacterium]OJV25419.1 MAG: hypothetical protein BGO26_10370 [Actinobacteria bacterium 69-20]